MVKRMRGNRICAKLSESGTYKLFLLWSFGFRRDRFFSNNLLTEVSGDSGGFSLYLAFSLEYDIGDGMVESVVEG